MKSKSDGNKTFRVHSHWEKRNLVFRVLKTRKAKLWCGYSEQHITEEFANFFSDLQYFFKMDMKLTKSLSSSKGWDPMRFCSKMNCTEVGHNYTFFLEQTLWFVDYPHCWISVRLFRVNENSGLLRKICKSVSDDYAGIFSLIFER